MPPENDSVASNSSNENPKKVLNGIWTVNAFKNRIALYRARVYETYYELIIQNGNDAEDIQHNLDFQEGAMLVIERGSPTRIMTPEAYGKGLLLATVNRERILCSYFGNSREKREFDLADLEIYRN